MRKLDCVIPHLNYPKLNECLETLHRNTPEGVLGKVILIDQNPEYKDYGKLVDIHLRTDNLGFAKACNTGIRLSDAEYVMLCNDDVRFVNKKWWQGIEDTFDKFPTAFFINPSSFRDPDPNRGSVVYTQEGLEQYEHEDMPDEVYDKLIKKDDLYYGGICMYASVLRSSLLDKLAGCVPGKAWLNEEFRYGGGEDYALQWHVGRSGFISLATGESWIYHQWHQTIHPLTGAIGAKYDSKWLELYSEKDEEGNILDTPDVNGQAGRKDVPTVTIRD